MVLVTAVQKTMTKREDQQKGQKAVHDAALFLVSSALARLLQTAHLQQ